MYCDKSIGHLFTPEEQQSIILLLLGSSHMGKNQEASLIRHVSEFYKKPSEVVIQIFIRYKNIPSKAKHRMELEVIKGHVFY